MTLQELLPIIAPVIVVELILLAVAWIDLFRREPERVKGPKWAWAVACLLGIIGPIAYFVFGRRD